MILIEINPVLPDKSSKSKYLLQQGAQVLRMRLGNFPNLPRCSKSCSLGRTSFWKKKKEFSLRKKPNQRMQTKKSQIDSESDPTMPPKERRSILSNSVSNRLRREDCWAITKPNETKKNQNGPRIQGQNGIDYHQIQFNFSNYYKHHSPSAITKTKWSKKNNETLKLNGWLSLLDSVFRFLCFSKKIRK